MPHYILAYDQKGPILYGPYSDTDAVLRKQASLENRSESEIIELTTNNRQRAARIIKERSAGLVNFRYGAAS